MSGGSYNYLFLADGKELFDKEEDLERMAERLAGLGYARDAAHETAALLLTLRQYKNYADTIIDRLKNIWQSVEWWDSCDSGEDGVKVALEKYREALTPKEKK